MVIAERSKLKAAALARRAARSPTGRRLLAAIREDPPEVAAPAGELDVDGWLTSLYGERLAEIEAACADAGPEAYALFRDLDDDLWALLLSRSYTSYPNILALLPEIPEPRLQENWNGLSGLPLLNQSKAFYRNTKESLAIHSEVELRDATILDFGCGWGRLTRFFARDVEPGSLLACDPVEEILDVCRRSRVPATLAKSEFAPERLPFEGLDLAFSFSVFTHISERAAEACLRALHAALNPGGLLVITLRPPAYLDLDPKLRSARDELGSDPLAALGKPRYIFTPHPTAGGHPQYEGGEMTYGEAVISLPYVRERWSELYDLVDVMAPIEDIYQVAVTLRKR